VPQELVNTVTGAIRTQDLGVTLMHEHILIGYPGWEADTLRPGPSRARSTMCWPLQPWRQWKPGPR